MPKIVNQRKKCQLLIFAHGPLHVTNPHSKKSTSESVRKIRFIEGMRRLGKGKTAHVKDV